MRPILILLSLCLFLTPSLSQRCGGHCAFRFCAANGVGFLRRQTTLVTVRPPRIALGASICNPTIPSLTRVLTVGEAQVADEDPEGEVEPSPVPIIPISKWRPDGLERPFSKRFFTVFPIRFQPDLSGLGRRRAKTNQNAYLHDRCFVLPVKSWQEKAEDGSLSTVFGNAEEDCVSFETSYPKVLVDLTWGGPDILELSLEEPDGTVLDKDNTRGARGRLSDNKMQGCNIAPAGFKSVVFDWRQRNRILSGQYKVTVRHARNCAQGATPWRLRVFVDDKRVYQKKGNSNAEGGAVVLDGSFMLDL